MPPFVDKEELLRELAGSVAVSHEKNMRENSRNAGPLVLAVEGRPRGSLHAQVLLRNVEKAEADTCAPCRPASKNPGWRHEHVYNCSRGLLVLRVLAGCVGSFFPCLPGQPRLPTRNTRLKHFRTSQAVAIHRHAVDRGGGGGGSDRSRGREDRPRDRPSGGELQQQRRREQQQLHSWYRQWNPPPPPPSLYVGVQ